VPATLLKQYSLQSSLARQSCRHRSGGREQPAAAAFSSYSDVRIFQEERPCPSDVRFLLAEIAPALLSVIPRLPLNPGNCVDTGKLGLYGASYLGFVEWAIAAELGDRICLDEDIESKANRVLLP
jgi:hypothetical protein